MRLLLLLLLILAGPALAQPRADPRNAELDRLFSMLKAAPSEEAAAAAETRIRLLWLQAGTPAVQLLLSQGARDLEGGDTDGALDSLDAAIVLEPDYAEARLRRAQAKFHVGDYPGAIRDIQAALQLEPRNFAALETLSHIAEAQADWKGALAAWEKVLDLDPRTAEAQDRLRMLRRKAYGEST